MMLTICLKIWKQMDFHWKCVSVCVITVCVIYAMVFFLFRSDRSLLQKHLFSIMHSSWKRWWKATSRTPCPTALYISVCSCSATRSWLDTWQRSVSCWTSWSQSSSTWWRVALLKVNFRVSCPNLSDCFDWTNLTTLQIVCVKNEAGDWCDTPFGSPHPMWTAWVFLTWNFRSECWACRLISLNIFGRMHGERFIFNVTTQNLTHSKGPVS